MILLYIKAVKKKAFSHYGSKQRMQLMIYVLKCPESKDSGYYSIKDHNHIHKICNDVLKVERANVVKLR